MTTFPHARRIAIRDAGLNEQWLQNQIAETPAILGLGELEVVERERRQSAGGRLDLLLKDPVDNSMYEAELMLGETDESHIIRTIEYWDIEKRRWPQRQHTAVLVAETINRRFFNVIQLLSNSIPIIAIQAALLKVGDVQTLFLTKVLDTYEEAEDGTAIEEQSYSREYWHKLAPWTLECADYVLDTTKEQFPDSTLNYLKYYIAINGFGYNLMWLRRRSSNKSLLGFRNLPLVRDELSKLLDESGMPFTTNAHDFLITVDKQSLAERADLLRKIAAHIRNARSTSAA